MKGHSMWRLKLDLDRTCPRAFQRAGHGLIGLNSRSHILQPLCRTLLSAEKMEHIAGPAGIAVDATDLYWANLKALQSQPGQCSSMVLSGAVSRFGA